MKKIKRTLDPHKRGKSIKKNNKLKNLPGNVTINVLCAVKDGSFSANVFYWHVAVLLL